MFKGHAPRERSAAVIASPGLAAFLDRHCGDHERDNRVSPPPAEQAVEKRTHEQDAGQVRAQQRLLRAGDGAGGAEWSTQTTMMPG